MCRLAKCALVTVLMAFIGLSTFSASHAQQKLDSAPPETSGQSKTFQLATLYWPPYTGQELPGRGLSSMIVRNALASEGITFLPIFYPWRRVTSSFNNDPSIIGYYPEYRAPELEERYLFSDPIGYSPLGFAYIVGTDFDWETFDDLRQFELGVVAGYINEQHFDDMARRDELSVVEANDDLTLIRLLVAGRIDAAVMDQQVMHYLIGTQPDLTKHAGQLIFHPHHLDNKSLHVVFPRSAEGKHALEALNQGLERFKVSQ
ncbi:MAG: substrate-binding periplasmic protein [Thalassospira sp.]|uniref:substrate-binding periplasmic protein n=1 Tax=Thalassospira sp. TaxID=1912094 RepID=UPI003A83756F